MTSVTSFAPIQISVVSPFWTMGALKRSPKAA
jgi:hypothetical protein